MGMPGATSLLPGRLQCLQVSLCSGLEVPAGKEPVKTYFQAWWPLTLLYQGTHLSGGSLGSMRSVPGSMASLMLATQAGVVAPSLAPSHVIPPLATSNLLRREQLKMSVTCQVGRGQKAIAHCCT